MATTPGGHGRGAMRGVVGGFSLSNVEMLSMPQYNKPRRKPHKNSCKPKPRSVEDLMARIGLEVCTLQLKLPVSLFLNRIISKGHQNRNSLMDV